MGIEQIAIITALIFSVILHEMAHGYMADWLGDPTPRLSGRLTGNPIAHIDPLGSVIIPAFLLLSHASFLFGWAKPVPYNPYNLSDQKYGEAKVAAAGPGMNFLIALVFSLFIRFSEVFGFSAAFVNLAEYIVFINILLALFNLIPFPPLDGSKILLAFLPYDLRLKHQQLMNITERFGLFTTIIFLFLFISLFWKPFSMVVFALFTLLTGTHF